MAGTRGELSPPPRERERERERERVNERTNAKSRRRNLPVKPTATLHRHRLAYASRLDTDCDFSRSSYQWLGQIASGSSLSARPGPSLSSKSQNDRYPHGREHDDDGHGHLSNSIAIVRTYGLKLRRAFCCSSHAVTSARREGEKEKKETLDV